MGVVDHKQIMQAVALEAQLDPADYTPEALHLKPDLAAIREHAQKCVEPDTCPWRRWQVSQLLDYTEDLEARYAFVAEELRKLRPA
jgi:hypothetical protein